MRETYVYRKTEDRPGREGRRVAEVGVVARQGGEYQIARRTRGVGRSVLAGCRAAGDVGLQAA
jgi:hypothetical protein